jgi:YfiH family protein
MYRQKTDGVVAYGFDALVGTPDVRAAVMTRIGGVSGRSFATLNLGHTVGDQLSAVEENHRRALGALGWGVEDMVSAYQVHGARVAVVGRGHRGTVQPACDGLVSADSGVPLLLRFADCVPVVFYDSRRGAIGVAHAGWRGVAADVASGTVRAMVDRLGCRAEDIWAGIGPSIGPCCYDVGDDVRQAVLDACPSRSGLARRDGSRWFLNLSAAVEAQLESAGVGSVERSSACTSCRLDEFFSHRAEGGKTGRFGVAVGLT